MKLVHLSLLLLVLFSLSVFAEEDNDDVMFLNLELENLLNLLSGILSFVLFLLTYSGYRHTNNKRLQYVSFAFLLFAIKGLLMTHELFFAEWSWVDPITGIFDFVILLVFFLGIVKK
ncbi:MAG TPA: hypothetical protein VJH37_04490 [Candidatus Nanoarchaeia archaeon]|nr:hypothetical protein [Candidatus Nanoarchaeia archaeon]